MKWLFSENASQSPSFEVLWFRRIISRKQSDVENNSGDHEQHHTSDDQHLVNYHSSVVLTTFTSIITNLFKCRNGKKQFLLILRVSHQQELSHQIGTGADQARLLQCARIRREEWDENQTPRQCDKQWPTLREAPQIWHHIEMKIPNVFTNIHRQNREEAWYIVPQRRRRCTPGWSPTLMLMSTGAECHIPPEVPNWKCPE